MIHDPVCEMEIKDTNEGEKTEYKGKTYYFCTPLCKIQFEQKPEIYVSKSDEGGHKHHHR